MSTRNNLHEIYRLVKQRERRATSDACRRAAALATERAAHILRVRTLKSVVAFARAERRWLLLASARAKPMATDFERAIRSGDAVVVRNHHHSFANGDNPPSGFVYVATCSEEPGCVKIGYSSLTPRKREQLLRSDSKALDIQFFCHIEVNHPAEIEHAVHQELRPFRTTLARFKGSNEWFAVSPIKARKTIQNCIRGRGAEC